jgi:5-methyltetrahydropteroyltriglutamate--homocysteine methyltransferase
MRLHAGICGSFPRPPKLRKAFDDLSEGKIGEGELKRILAESIRDVVKLQERAGMSIVTSGLLSWHDLFRPFTISLEGLEAGRLIRFFDNNFYYRCPTITGKIRWRGPITLEEIQEVRGAAHGLVKAVIPGPFTFLKLSENRFYTSEDELLDDLIEALRAEVEVLKSSSDLIQVDEPSLVDPELGRSERLRGVDIVNEFLTRLDVPSDRVIVATYFNLDPERYAMILDLRAGLHVDLKSTPTEADQALKEHGFEGPILSLGIIDSRNIYPMDPREVVYHVKTYLDYISPDILVFSTSSWLDYIPYNEAVRKLDALGRILAEAEVRFI